MKLCNLALSVLLFLFPATNGLAREAPQKVVYLAYNALVLYGKDPLIIAVVKGRNAKKRPLAEIKKVDKAWQKAPGISDDMRAVMESECAKYLKKIKISKHYFAEIFLMDNQGANVAITDKTSDYWQGDEVKFQKSFNQGVGAVFIDEVQFDESTQAHLVQVSVPVMDDDKAIGAITFGIDVEKVE